MAIKWIVTDMDGTLLDGKDRISEETIAYLIACQKKGVRLVLASGRSYVRLMPYVKELQMEQYNGFLVEINGLALNRLGTGERTVYAQLEKEDIRDLYSCLDEQNTEIQGYEDDTIYYKIPGWQRIHKVQEREECGYREDHPLVGSAWSWVISNDFSHNYPYLIEISSLEELPKRLNKINCDDTPEHIEQIFSRLQARFAGKYEMVRTCPRLIEIAPGGVTKGKTLERLMQEEKISRDEILVFGDGENDVDMFRKVVHSIAMGNAADYVKEHASEVTDSNNGEGVLKILKKYQVL